MAKITPAQLSKLRLEAKARGWDSAEEAAIAAGVPVKKNGRLNIQFDLDSTQASFVITELTAGRLLPPSDPGDEAIDLSMVPTDDLLAELARRVR